VAPLPYLLAAGAGTLVAAIVAAMVAAAVAVAPFAVGGVIGLRNGRSLVLS
jgi:Na+/phosphate symporter